MEVPLPPVNQVLAMGLEPEYVGRYRDALITLKGRGQSFAEQITRYCDVVRAKDNAQYRCMFLDAVDYITENNDSLVSRRVDPGPEWEWNAQMNEANSSLLRLTREDLRLPPKNKKMSVLYTERLCIDVCQMFKHGNNLRECLFLCSNSHRPRNWSLLIFLNLESRSLKFRRKKQSVDGTCFSRRTATMGGSLKRLLKDKRSCTNESMNSGSRRQLTP